MCALYLCLADKPSAPEKVMAMNINFTSISIKWTAPRDTGRCEITAYRLKISQLLGTRNKQINDITQRTNALLKHTFKKLTKATAYQISVSALNKAGQGLTNTATFKTGGKKGKDKRLTLYGLSQTKVCRFGLVHR